MVKAIRYVKDAFINSGSGILDFAEDVKALKPDIFFVNSDGYTPGKKRFCEENGIELVVSQRVPEAGLPTRSTTALRQECKIPYRIDLAGGWLDQPFVSQHHPGPVLTISIEPDYDFNNRGGMSTSSRKAAIEMWHIDIPAGDRETLAKMVFRYENPPGRAYTSGSQDAIGIVMPCLNKLNYDNDYWPTSIESVKDADTMFLPIHALIQKVQNALQKPQKIVGKPYLQKTLMHGVKLQQIHSKHRLRCSRTWYQSMYSLPSMNTRTM